MSDNGQPTANGDNGRDGATGRFAKGWKGGPGNPQVASVARYRAALVAAVTVADITEVVEVLVKKAKAGEDWAIGELLTRTIGKPAQPITGSDGEALGYIKFVGMPEDEVLGRK